METITNSYLWTLESGDSRVKDWFLLGTPVPILVIYFAYLATVWIGPKLMKNREPFNLKYVMLPYNVFMVLLSAFMCYEFFMSAYLEIYSLICQPVDYSNNPNAIRMARVCWWYFFSKVIELLDTIFFILKKNDRQITFLHVYHHSTMLLNWWLGANYIAGGQSFFLAMVNTFVHVIMYSYYALAGIGPHMQRYLWWKKYITKLQLSQFVIVIIHTTINIFAACSYPKQFNYVVVAYAISLIVLFSNFYKKTYNSNNRQKATAKEYRNGISNCSLNSNLDRYVNNGIRQR